MCEFSACAQEHQNNNGRYNYMALKGQVCTFLQMVEFDKAKSTALLFSLDSEQPRCITDGEIK